MKDKERSIILQDNLIELEAEELERTTGGDSFFKIIVANICEGFKDLYNYFEK